jgi:uncharacterized membrane-anchored protein
MTPQEMLHLMGCGIYKYLLLGIRDIIGMGDKNSSVKGLVNDIFPDIISYTSVAMLARIYPGCPTGMASSM